MDIILAFIALCNSIVPHIEHLANYSSQHLGSFKRYRKPEYEYLHNILEMELNQSNFHGCFKTLLKKLIESLRDSHCSSDLKSVEVLLNTFINNNNNNYIFDKQFDSSDLAEFKENFEFVTAYANSITICEDEFTQSSNTVPIITNTNPEIVTVSYLESKLQQFMASLESKLQQTTLAKNSTRSSNNNNNNNNNNNTISNNINSFHEAENLVKNKYNKNIRYKHHIDTLKEHTKNQTSPPALFFNRFPTPMLHDDSNFVDKYNNLIQEFQKNTMGLIIDTLENRIEINNNDLLNIKTKFKDDTSIDSKFKNIEESAQSQLKGWLENKHYSNLKYKAIPFKVINHLNYKNNNSNNNLNNFHIPNKSNNHNQERNNFVNKEKNNIKQRNNNYQHINNNSNKTYFDNNNNFNNKTNNRPSRSRNNNYTARSTSRMPIRSVSRSSNFPNSWYNNNNNKNNNRNDKNHYNNNDINNNNNRKNINMKNNNNNKENNNNKNKNVIHDQQNFPRFQPQPLMQLYQQPQPPHPQNFQQLEPLPQRQRFQQNQHFLQPPNFHNFNY